MRLHAYVLAGDPAWAGESIASYYGVVDRIFVSYDRSHRSWAGHPLSVEESLRRIAAADPDGKTVLLPGEYAQPGRPTPQLETEQRQVALDAASDGADWVIQLDTDEIVTSPETLRRHVERAEQRAAEALEYPLRDIYADASSARSGRFLEHCGRFWTTQSAYPGPVAVRAGTRLSTARQTGMAPLYRVDVAPWNTDPAHSFDARVHAVIPAADAILHLSWVRSEPQMAEKRVVSGYAGHRDWDRDLAKWRWRSRHPLLTALAAPFARDPFGRFRITELPALAGRQP